MPRFFKNALLLVALFFSTAAMAAVEIVVYRDPGCGCCEKWAAIVEQRLNRPVKMVDAEDRPDLRRKLGAPADLESCHTAVIDGYFFEGHVPVADIEKVLSGKVAEVKGLMVPGMPIGSEGMEIPGRGSDPYQVVAVTAAGTYIFSQY